MHKNRTNQWSPEGGVRWGAKQVKGIKEYIILVAK